VASRSFNIGTVRLLKDKVSKAEWDEFKAWIEKNTNSYNALTAIGSGGNINKLSKMSGVKKGRPISLSKLKRLEEMLRSYSLEERIKVLGLKPDRADVIVPASHVLVTALKTAGIEKMIVPEIGLSDGIVHLLYERYSRRR
jgi:exopolyphosphatase / guanosine-5'-triphosphate,3'-diphosphate pyrophosphatase